MNRLSLVFVLVISLLLVNCSPESPKRDPKVKVNRKTEGHKINTRFTPEVDILFVIDDSGSMSSYQQNLSKNARSFLDEIKKNQLIDYHIGVITSDTDLFNKTGGELVGNPAFIDKNVIGGLVILERRLVAGINGSGNEKFLSPVFDALTPPLNAPGGKNFGFLRKDAFLAIIFITDTEDQSRIDPQSLYNELVQIKNSKEKVISYAAIIPSHIASPRCHRDSEGAPYKIENFLQLTLAPDQKEGDNYFNLCDEDYGKKLASIGNDLTKRVGLFIPLGQFPILNSIKVSYGTQVIPPDAEKGWVYDPSRVGIKLSPELELKEEPGAELDVSFLPASIENK